MIMKTTEEIISKDNPNYKYNSYSFTEVQNFMIEYGKQLLIEASERTTTKCLNMESFGSENQSSCSECEYHIVDKSSILNIINELK